MKFHRGEFIELIYLDDNDCLSQRHVRVLSVKDGKLIGYCYFRRNLRCFSLDQILSYRKHEKDMTTKREVI